MVLGYCRDTAAMLACSVSTVAQNGQTSIENTLQKRKVFWAMNSRTEEGVLSRPVCDFSFRLLFRSSVGIQVMLCMKCASRPGVVPYVFRGD